MRADSTTLARKYVYINSTFGTPSYGMHTVFVLHVQCKLSISGSTTALMANKQASYLTKSSGG